MIMSTNLKENPYAVSTDSLRLWHQETILKVLSDGPVGKTGLLETYEYKNGEYDFSNPKRMPLTDIELRDVNDLWLWGKEKDAVEGSLTLQIKVPKTGMEFAEVIHDEPGLTSYVMKFPNVFFNHQDIYRITTQDEQPVAKPDFQI